MLKRTIFLSVALAAAMYAKQAMACEDPKHGHPKGQKCDRDTVVNNTSSSQSGAVSGSTSTSTSSSNSASNSTSSSNATGGASNSDASATGGSSTSSSNATSGDSNANAAGGQGGAGGAGGSGGEGGSADSANLNANVAGGARVVTNNTSTSVNKIMNFTPVQVTPLPPTISVAGAELRQVAACGRMWDITPNNQVGHVPTFFGLWPRSVEIKNVAGPLNGPAKVAYLEDHVPLPAPFNPEGEEEVTLWGHALYVLVAQESRGGGSSGALNYVGDKAMGGGASNATASTHVTATYVAIPCPRYQGLLKTKPNPPAPAAEAAEQHDLAVEKVKVRSDKGRYVAVPDTDPKTLCGAKPGEKCAWQSEKVEVVKEVGHLGKGASKKKDSGKEPAVKQ